MSKTSIAVTVVVVAALAGVGGFFYWQHQQNAAASAVVAGATPEEEPAAVAPAPSAPASAPGILYPLPASAADAGSAPVTDVNSALAALLDGATMRALIQPQDLARHIVATIDNLGRAEAPPTLWPVKPVPGRFMVEQQADGSSVLATANAARYTPFVVAIESVDMSRAALLYIKVYPQLQQAYTELGFPGRYFNDRLVEVIDLLLATPEPATPPSMHLPQINGPLRPERPWVLYEFDDPALQSLSAGQRLLLRTGPENERRLKQRLKDFRAFVTRSPRSGG